MEIGFMHATEWPEEGAQSRASALTTIAMYFAYAIAVVIPRPLVLSVIDRRVVLLDSVVAAILVGVDDCSLRWNGFGQNALARRLVAVSNHPAALLARLTTDDMNDRR